MKKKNSLIAKPSKTDGENLPQISNIPEVSFKKNSTAQQDQRFTNYFQQKYANSQIIMQDFHKTLSNYSFLGVKLSEKPKSSLKVHAEPSELFVDNYIGHRHNKKPRSSQTSRSQTSYSKFRIRNILPPSVNVEDPINLKAKYEKILDNLNLLLYNADRFSQIFESFSNIYQKNNPILTVLNDYWEFLVDIDRESLFSPFLSKKIQQIIKKSLIYEIIYMGLTHYLFFLYLSSCHIEKILFFLKELEKKIYFIMQNYELMLCIFIHIIKHIPKAQRMIEFQLLREGLEKKFFSIDFDESMKKIIYNNKTLDCYNKDFFHLLLLKGGNFLKKSSVFEIFEFFLSTEINDICIKSLKNQIIQALTKILKPTGFFSEKDQMKDIFLTGTFSNLNIENLDLEEAATDLPTEPFLQPNQTQEYSLILDLEGVLLCSKINEENEISIEKRPNIENFLKEISKFYELIVFSASSKEFVESALEVIDPNQLIKHKLYREHFVQINKTLVKDLSKLGRDLQKVICVDHSVEQFQMQPENGIYIKKWEGDEKDDSLNQLTFLLKHIAKKKFTDLRKALIIYRDQVVRLMWNDIKVELI